MALTLLRDWFSAVAAALLPLLQGKVIRHPRRKCVVMLCGNHSAGKSSFVNWYVGEDVQGTGVAVETQVRAWCMGR